MTHLEQKQWLKAHGWKLTTCTGYGDDMSYSDGSTSRESTTVWTRKVKGTIWQVNLFATETWSDTKKPRVSWNATMSADGEVQARILGNRNDWASKVDLIQDLTEMVLSRTMSKML